MTMQRLNTICLVLVSLPFILPVHCCGEQPNVLMIAIDDLNDWVGCLGGHPQAKTPHIRRLIESGVSFTQAHCNIPICNPSRASFITPTSISA